MQKAGIKAMKMYNFSVKTGKRSELINITKTIEDYIFLDNLAPKNNNYRHAEGNSDAHIKAAIIGN